MKYDSDTCRFVDLESGDLDEVIGWLERIRRNEYEPEPEWARACIEDGPVVQNESDRRFYTSTKMYQEVSLLVIAHLRGTPRVHLIRDPTIRESIRLRARQLVQEAWDEENQRRSSEEEPNDATTRR